MFCENDLNSRLMLAALRNLRTSHKWYALVVWTPQKKTIIWWYYLASFLFLLLAFAPFPFFDFAAGFNKAAEAALRWGWTVLQSWGTSHVKASKCCMVNGRFLAHVKTQTYPHCWWNQSIRFYLWPFVEIGFHSGGRVRTDFVHLLWMSCAWLDWLSQDRQ